MCRSLAQRVWLAESEAQKLDTSGWHDPLRLDTSTLVNPLTGLEQESKRDRLATKPNKTTTTRITRVHGNMHCHPACHSIKASIVFLATLCTSLLQQCLAEASCAPPFSSLSVDLAAQQE